MTLSVKLTRQGVRDLGGNGRKNKKPELAAIKQCSHKRMKQCHVDNRHWSCPDCGLSWDESVS